ncbi:unnamed protein product [Sphagnum troendelagicum]|uniref:Uncharacterized protein n=1 Tax=Sphagnum troendelagicum TaxID=128251 RepID=A0ABP0U8P8_9BRYO
MLKTLQNDGLQNKKLKKSSLTGSTSPKQRQMHSFCPGYTQTDMTDSKGNNTPEQGADTGVWLALQPPGAPSGKFWGEHHELAF